MSEKPKKKALPLKQRMFVAEVLMNPTKTQTECYKKIYPNASHNSAEDSSSRILAKPEAKEHINEVLARLYPDLTSTAGTVLYEMVTDGNKPDSIRLKALELLSKFQGWNAPTRVNKQILTADLSKFKLPGTGDPK